MIRSSLKLAGAGIILVSVGLTWSWFDYKREHEAFISKFPEWHFEPGPVPVHIRVLILAGLLVILVGAGMTAFNIIRRIQAPSVRH
jgi:hypothetical protein